MVTPSSGFEWCHLRRWETVAVAVAEEEDAFAESLSTLGGLDPLASSSTRPYRLNETPGTAFDIRAVVTTQDWLDGFGSLVGVIERDGGDKVVKDVRLYNAMHQGPTDEAEFTVNRCSSAASEIPGCVLVMREGGIGMLKISDCDCDRGQRCPDLALEEQLLTQPVVDPQIRKEIPHSQVRPAKVLPNQDENSGYNSKAQIARKNQLAVLGLIQGTRRIKVVDVPTPAVLLALTATFFLTGMAIVTSDVDGEVHDPSGELLTDEGTSSNDGSLLGELSQLMISPSNLRRVLFAGLGNENHVTIEVSGRLVVLAMRDLPREVRD